MLNDSFHSIVRKFDLIAEYNQRPRMQDLFEGLANEKSEAEDPLELNNLASECFLSGLAPTFIALYIGTASSSVLEYFEEGHGHGISLGTFLATIKIYTELSEVCEDTMKVTEKVARAITPLRDLTILFNKPTDLFALKSINRVRRVQTKEYRSKLLSSSSTVQFKTDLIPITINSLGFRYNEMQDYWVIRHANLSVEQGSMVALVGLHGSGKATFLKLLGGRLFPTEGSIYVPTHLRVCHVSSTPVLMKMSVWSNLVFGNHFAPPDRVRKILRALKLDAGSGSMLALMNKDLAQLDIKKTLTTEEEEAEGDEESDWSLTTTYATKAKMHLARALTMNAELTVLQRPFMHYDEVSIPEIMEVLHNHNVHRGLGLPPETAATRRPRTIFFSADSVAECQYATTIWQMSPEKEGEVVLTTREELLKSGILGAKM
eukprot:gnl/TRDRNA2_/TRDRNA2_161569_c0_seq1.p1 gnl/TRDRNA2_/TRDRNA2_161569_c0~~gnl/TRDRNA2_/TRDRNA2_161569_c0_seq1.p1  ORF type:complete len:432 (+),score=55.65 gnl/TRDRNA2_/TRDRNA2_161569_c0_seq1:3-1298(+)